MKVAWKYTRKEIILLILSVIFTSLLEAVSSFFQRP
ncbi:hypothetical protein J2Z62_000608 [Mycoplasmoides fastidiosum]|uniref:ABC transporter permease n=1 Tax=Mycoplasmoides fastidiosum TaxID=92758 RepID=A0ABU0M003_9BACT|nr:hypothetical protein [Mycoplasmoides fastidiosum]